MSTLNVILTHQHQPAVESMIRWWKDRLSDDKLVIAYGGPEAEFKKLDFADKFLITSERLSTKDHQRERQSYQPVFQAITNSGLVESYDYVHLAEYDQIPLQNNINQLQASYLEEQNADGIGYRLQRVDGTNNVHYLSHATDDSFFEFLKSISVREDQSTVLSMLGFGGFWKAEAFQAVARIAEPLPIYLELFMPTIAHHLGFRLRSTPPSPFISTSKQFSIADAQCAQSAGEWFIHPVKDQWPTTTT
ncbi:MAG: hypothetical protein ACI9DF_001428 [Verrucomicrobiales bacterium]|jgi:hypothetical protein